MSHRFDAAEAFAYVDNCLAAADRRAFEERLRDDPELRRRVDVWEAQNRAIRVAFGAVASARAPIDLASGANENAPVRPAAVAATRRPADVVRAQPIRPALAAARRMSSSGARAGRFVVARRVLAAATFVVATLAPGAPGGATWPRAKLTEAGLAAYRAFAAPDATVEFRTGDPRDLTRWLTPQVGGKIAAPELSSSTLNLLGGRIAPGAAARAAFLVYEDRRGQRVGLLIEPLDAPPPSSPILEEARGVSFAAWTDAGRALVAVGADRDDVAELVALVEESPSGTR